MITGVHGSDLRRHSWRHLLAWCLGRRERVRVTGHSMTPALLDGDHVLVQPHHGPPQRGAVVWVRDPRQPERLMVKRVHEVLADGRLDLRGDNPVQSTDSRHFGPVHPELVKAQVAWRFPR